jgi:hypothetical protein
LDLVGEPELQQRVEEELKKDMESKQSKEPSNIADEEKKPASVNKGENEIEDVDAFRYEKVWSPSIPHERRRKHD